MRARWLAIVALAGCDAQIGAPSLTDAGATVHEDASDAAPDGAAVDAAPPDALPCVEGDANVVDPDTGHCYMIFTATPASWDGARLQCEARGAHLVVSTSQAENDLFSPLAGVADIWVGGTDQDAEGTWTWLTGEPMTYTNWRMGEPNDYGDGEDCMLIEGDNGGLWDDRSCELMYGYLCERE